MFRTKRSRLALAAAAATAAGAAASLTLAGLAAAHNDTTKHDGPPVHTVTAAATADDATYLVAALNGRNEVPGTAGPVGDKDGQAVEVLRLKGNQIAYAMKWSGIAAPTAAHIHAGATGTNGAVQVPFFATPLPGTLNAVVGSATADPKLVASIESNPGGFYANIHTAEFTGGAVRGQLHKVAKPVDLNQFLRGGPLAANLDGNQEVPGAKPAGDPAGHASSFVQAAGDHVNFSFSWTGITSPTEGHIHQGPAGVNGAVAVPLFDAPTGLPASVTGVAGVATGVKPALTRDITNDPTDFYTNLHTATFDGGAVRGQLFRAGADWYAFDQSSFIASVLKGQQIYACTRQADGSYAFTQHNVEARLQGGIHHTFVKNDAGPPQWVAADRSSVSGTLVTKLPNGTGNIAELDLTLTRTGAATGHLASAVEVERLNTVGGLAPAGSCDPAKQPIAKSDYQADYLFLVK